MEQVNSNVQSQPEQNQQQSKAIYAQPQLVKHGQIEQMTQGKVPLPHPSQQI